MEWIRKLWEAGWWKGKGDGAEMEWRAAMYGRELRSNERSGTTELRLAKETSPENILKRVLLFYLTF